MTAAFEKEKKVWGTVEHYKYDEWCGVSRLTLLPDTYCSIHRHRQRVNSFLIIKGRVDVLTFGAGEGPTMLPNNAIHLEARALRYIQIPKDVWHQFRVIDPSEMIEVYYPQDEGDIVSFDDIDRFSLGGTSRA